ncbi:MAG: alpha/beta hydrolase [Spirochaetaceae bacterium]
MSKFDFIKGVSSNKIPYTKWGCGSKNMIIFSGGPGNMLPSKPDMMTKQYNPFLEDYTIHMVARKAGLVNGYTTENIADDYASMINNDLGGKVSVVIGESYGGMVMQHFASKYSDLSDKFIILVAANKISEIGRDVDYTFSRLLSLGKPRKAAAKIAEALVNPGLGQILLKGMMWLIGGSIVDTSQVTFTQDIMIEAEAELNHDATDALKKITVQVLIICGDSDIYFPIEFVEETANLIPNSLLKIYEGKGHMSTISDKRLIKDIQEFIN